MLVFNVYVMLRAVPDLRGAREGTCPRPHFRKGAEIDLMQKIIDQQFGTYLSEVIEKFKIVHEMCIVYLVLEMYENKLRTFLFAFCF